MMTPLGHEQIRTIRHDLRTPVNHIIGYSEILLEESDAALDAPWRSEAQAILYAGAQLLSQISACVDAAEESGVLDLSQLRLRVHPLASRILSSTRQLRQHWLAQADVPAVSDVDQIERAVGQLLQLVGEHMLVSSPLARTQPEQSAVPLATGPGGQLLVVDDNESNRELLQRRLSRMGYQVTMAEHGRQALELLQRSPFDLILLDIVMPELDGYQVLAYLRDDEELHHIPVIVLSTLDDVEGVARCIELGAMDYLIKPFNPILLQARINACLEQKFHRDREVLYLAQIQQEKQRADDFVNLVIPLGVALSAEKDFNRLLERIVLSAMGLCNADGGTLYLCAADRELRFMIVRNVSLQIAMGGTTATPIPFAPLPLHDSATGQPNLHYVVTYTALTGQSLNIADAYTSDTFDFSGTRAFDLQTGYHSTSLLTVPLKDANAEVIGVLQLLNAQRQGSPQVIAFAPALQQMIESLSALAAVALGFYIREERLRQQISELRIEVDEVRQGRQVAEITESEYFQNLQAKVQRMRRRTSMS